MRRDLANLRDQARNKWPSILDALGIEVDPSGKHGPCPVCGGKDRFRFDNQDGRGTFICNNCGSGDGANLVMLKLRLSFRDAANRVREVLGEATETATPKRRELTPEQIRAALNDLWTSSSVIGVDDAGRYLRSRGLAGPFPNALRVCPSVRVTDCPGIAALPAMVAMVTAPNGTPANIHRTYLQNGHKAAIEHARRMMPGKIPDGSAIRLGTPIDGRLGIAEGIETALHATKRTGIPCWSAINSTMLEKFQPPADVRELHIFGDHDAKFGGQAAAFRLAHRLACKPNAPRVIVRIPGIFIDPEAIDMDWADDVPDFNEERIAARG